MTEKKHTKVKKTFRHEIKYYINYFEYESLKRRLNKVLTLDKHAQSDGSYHIRSLYFDDIKNTALYEKQAGILSRKKYRIRIYNLSNQVIKLEKKERQGNFISKVSTTLSLSQFHKIINNDVEFLKKSDNTLEVEFYFDLKAYRYKPEVIVDYQREAYISKLNNIRITFDMKLRSGMYNYDIFNNDLPTIDVLEEPKMILEIKYDHFLPDHFRNLLQIGSSQKYAISKYVICKKFMKLNSWEDN